MNFIITIFAFVAALGCLITFHEYGHYKIARWCNVRVLRFSVGFGKPLWTWRTGEDRTEWVIAAIPLGGYVKMLDEREGEVAAEDLPRAFNRQNVWRRSAIVVAGPLANFLLAIVLYWALFMHGVPGTKPVLGEPLPATAAAAARFEAGEIVRKIGDDPVGTWQDARWVLLQYAVRKSTVAVETITGEGKVQMRNLDLSQMTPADLDSDFLRIIGFTRFQPKAAPVVGKITSGGAAERSGLKGGDEIVSVDNAAVESIDQVIRAIRENYGRALLFEVRREKAAVLTISITPEAHSAKDGRVAGRIGAELRYPDEMYAQYRVEVRYGPLESLLKALAKTWDTSVFSLKMLGKMITGDVSLKNLSGPITIADYAGQSAQLGWTSYLVFLALISISLGVLNLLPVPLLDGGHLMYYIVEIFKGAPVSDRAIEFGQRIGMALLFVLMAVAIFNDLQRLISG